MSTTRDALGGPDWQRLIASAASTIQDHADELSRLDAVAGDGDHGINVASALEHASAAVMTLDSPMPADVVLTTANSFLDEMGGAAGALFGSFFLSMSRSFDGHLTIGTSQLADGLVAGTAMVEKRGKAKVGDKTMVDALVPASDAARAADVSGSTIATAFAEMADAAREGAMSTESMTATLGRARYAGPASVGTPDPGATTVALIFESWAVEFPRYSGEAG